MRNKVIAGLMTLCMITATPVAVYADEIELMTDFYETEEVSEEAIEEEEDSEYIEENGLILDEDGNIIDMIDLYEDPEAEMPKREYIVPHYDKDSMDYGNDLGEIHRESRIGIIVDPHMLNSTFYDFTDEEIYLMAQLAWHEAGCEGDVGMIAVVEVVLNRLYSDRFPDTVEEVIYQPRQFSYNYELKNITPSDELLMLVREVISGRVWVLGDSEILFYRNPDICIGVPSTRVHDWGRFQYAGYVKHHAFYFG